MPQINELDLENQIKNSNFKNLYFIYGDEKYLVKYYSDKLIKKVLNDNFTDFNFNNFNTVDLDIDKIADAAEALPFMADIKCVKVNDLDIETIGAKNVDKLKELVSDLPDTTVLVLTYPAIDINVKKSSKWKSFISFVSKYGNVFEIQKKDINSLRKQLIKWAKKRNCLLNDDNADEIVKTCGDNLLVLNKEMEKLCAFANEKEITSEIISTVATKNVETTVFLLANAIVSKDYKKAYKQLDILFYQREEPVAILAVLANVYVDMYRVKVALENGYSIQDISSVFDYKNKEFKLRNAQRDSRKISLEVLRSSLNALLKADRDLKSVKINKRIIMEKLIAELFVISQKGCL